MIKHDFFFQFCLQLLRNYENQVNKSALSVTELLKAYQNCHILQHFLNFNKLF